MSESTGISQPPDKFRRPHVVIIGGGFAGIAAVKALRDCEADVTIIDRRNHHIFQPLLYQVETAVLAPPDVPAPLGQLPARQKNPRVEAAGCLVPPLSRLFCARARSAYSRPSPNPRH